jgi:hypothetical protein
MQILAVRHVIGADKMCLRRETIGNFGVCRRHDVSIFALCTEIEWDRLFVLCSQILLPIDEAVRSPVKPDFKTAQETAGHGLGIIYCGGY